MILEECTLSSQYGKLSLFSSLLASTFFKNHERVSPFDDDQASPKIDSKIKTEAYLFDLAMAT